MSILRIASYNIHKGVSAFGRQARIHHLKQAIAGLDADILFLQEVQGRHDVHAQRHAGWPDAGQHEFLAGDSHHHVYGKNAVYQHGHHGNALLSRYPIFSSANHDVSDHRLEQRGILHARVGIGEIAVHCFVIHLGLFAASRRRQIQALIDTVRRDTPDNEPVIIAGDFNDWNQQLSQTLYQELGVVEAFDAVCEHGQTSALLPLARHLRKQAPVHARTFPAGFPWLCLDRVYTRGFRISEATVLQGAPWRQLSDHAPIMVQLDFAESR